MTAEQRCNCPLHRGHGSLERVSKALKKDHHLSAESSQILGDIVREAYSTLKRRAAR